jgi:hypothetical protein
MQSAGAKGGSAPAGQTTTTAAPLPYMYPYIGTGLSQAGDLLGSGGPQYYSGQSVAGFSQPQQAAFSGIDTLANSGDAADNAGAAYDANLLKGKYAPGSAQANLQAMGTGSMSNPELQNLMQLGNDQIMGQATSEFGGAGRNAEASLPGQEANMGTFDSNLLSNAYNTNQADALAANQTLGSEQSNALGMVPQLNAMKLGNLQAEGGVGQQVQNLAQQQIGANQGMFNFYQDQPYQQLGQYEGLLGALQPGTATSNPYFTNPTANMLGMGLAGEQLYNGFSGKGG